MLSPLSRPMISIFAHKSPGDLLITIPFSDYHEMMLPWIKHQHLAFTASSLHVGISARYDFHSESQLKRSFLILEAGRADIRKAYQDGDLDAEDTNKMLEILLDEAIHFIKSEIDAGR